MDVQREHDQTYQATDARRVVGWVDLRGRRLGMWAFALHRITGIGLVAYLLLHLLVLSMLVQGQAGWDSFVALARSPVFLALDVILLAGILIHGLNGIRVALLGAGYGVGRQKPAFAGLLVAAAIILVLASFRIFAVDADAGRHDEQPCCSSRQDWPALAGGAGSGLLLAVLSACT
jgi:succinate dehydrogenase / fumarate reductase cytochrome b subunit